MAVKFEVDARELTAALKQAIDDVKDLTVPLTLITKDWFQSNKAIFTLKGPGKYVDLSEKYKKAKQKKVGFVYPILRRSGLLESSITNPADTNSINLIINGQTLILGTKVSYAAYHQFGTKHLPVRPVIFTNGEQSAPDDQFNRLGAWKQILTSYVLQKTKNIGKVSGE